MVAPRLSNLLTAQLIMDNLNQFSSFITIISSHCSVQDGLEEVVVLWLASDVELMVTSGSFHTGSL